MNFLGQFWDVVFSDGKVHGAIGLAISFWVLGREVGISQSVASTEPSECLVLHCMFPCLTLPGGGDKDRLVPQTHTQIFGPGS